MYEQYPSNLWFFEDAGTAVVGMYSLLDNIQKALTTKSPPDAVSIQTHLVSRALMYRLSLMHNSSTLGRMIDCHQHINKG